MDISSELTSKETQQVSSSQLNDVPSTNSSLGLGILFGMYYQEGNTRQDLQRCL
jgi:hypothetical protein